MRLTMYQIDAFADKVFTGNPAAVCPLDSWLPDELMQQIAAENNLSETAFFVPAGTDYHIRWFTPASEVDLCGHATLASAFVIFYLLNDCDGDIRVCSKTDDIYENNRVCFHSKSGILNVYKKQDKLELDFPVIVPKPCSIPKILQSAFSEQATECLKAMDYILIFDNENQICNAKPDLNKLKKLGLRGVGITAPATDYDFVCRFFAPKQNIDEDPVTGSLFTQLTPYWADKFNKTRFKAKQVSARGGEVTSELKGDRVKISGKAVKYMEAVIEV